jgi:hypothetical protein
MLRRESQISGFPFMLSRESEQSYVATLPLASESWCAVPVPDQKHLRMSRMTFPASKIAAKVAAGASPGMRKDIVDRFMREHERYIHNDMPHLGKVVQRKRSNCQRARFCVCHLPSLVKLGDVLVATMRQHVCKGSMLRAVFEQGMLVLQFEVSDTVGECHDRFWVYCPFAHLTTWEAALFKLRVDSDEHKCEWARSSAAIALELLESPSAITWWQLFADSNLESRWTLSFKTLSARPRPLPFKFCPSHMIIFDADYPDIEFWRGLESCLEPSVSKVLGRQVVRHPSGLPPRAMPPLLLALEDGDGADDVDSEPEQPLLDLDVGLFAPGEDHGWNDSQASNSSGSHHTWNIEDAKSDSSAPEDMPEPAVPPSPVVLGPSSSASAGPKAKPPRRVGGVRGGDWKIVKFPAIDGEIHYSKAMGKMDAHCLVATHTLCGQSCKWDKSNGKPSTSTHRNRRGRSAAQLYTWLQHQCDSKPDHSAAKKEISGETGFPERLINRLELIELAQVDEDVAGLLQAERSAYSDEDIEPKTVPYP